ncbi:MAG: glutaredoxin domain-containing protein [Oleispira sp.]
MINKWTLVLIFCVGYYFWDNKGVDIIEPLYAQPYVVVYGRDSCGITKKTKKYLDRKGISYQYENVDDNDVANLLHSRMRAAGLATRRYNLPVIDVNGEMAVRPKNDWIANTFVE